MSIIVHFIKLVLVGSFMLTHKVNSQDQWTADLCELGHYAPGSQSMFHTQSIGDQHSKYHLQATTVIGSNNVWVADAVVGAEAAPAGSRERRRNTQTVGAAHRAAMLPGITAMAKRYLKKYPERTVVPMGIGVLDPRDMWKWPDSDVPGVFQVYQMVMSRLWKTKQIASISPIIFEWAETHGFVLSDDFLRQSIYEAFQDGQWIMIPFLLSSRSVSINVTRWNECGIPLPPPLNDTHYPPPYTQSYGWTHFRDQMVQLARCGVKKPLILEECMTHPWLTALLHNFNIYLYGSDAKTCGWKGEKFVDVIYDILWPILHEARLADPTQSMVKQWINWNSPIMQEYEATPLSQWPPLKPTPIPRSECDLASSILGASSHYSPKPGTSPAAEIRLVDSPGTVNSFQPWGWAKSARRLTANVTEEDADWAKQMADDWLRFVADYTNPDLLAADLASKSVPPFESVRARPEFQAIITGTERARINERLVRKGRPLNYPNSPIKYMDLFEGYAIVSRFLHDLMFKSGLTAANWNNEDAVRSAIRMARDRACAMLESIARPDCVYGEDTIRKNEVGAQSVAYWDETKVDKTCRVSDESAVQLQQAPDAVTAIPCLHPRDTYYALDDNCNPSDSMLTARIQWNAGATNVTCQVTDESLASIPMAEATVLLDCPVIVDASNTGSAFIGLWVILFVGQVVLLLLVVVKRKTKAILASSWRWSCVLIAGSMLLLSSVLTTVGERSEANCVQYMVLTSFGVVIMFSSLFVKLFRIQRIFEAKNLVPLRLTDVKLFLGFLALLMVNLVFVLAWTFSTDTHTQQTPLTHAVVRNVSFQTCAYGEPAIIWVWLIFILVLVLANLYVTWMIRSVPDSFSETKVLLFIASGMAFMIVAFVPLFLTSTSEVQRELIKDLMAFLLGLGILSVYFGPKFYFVYAKPDGNTLKNTRMSDDKTNAGGSGTQGNGGTGRMYQMSDLPDNNNTSTMVISLVQPQKPRDRSPERRNGSQTNLHVPPNGSPRHATRQAFQES